jgi:iron complex transport system substrate-binding protein
MMTTANDIAGVLEQIELLGEATGHSSEAGLLVSTMQDEIDGIVAEHEGEDAPAVYHELDNQYFSAGTGSFIGDLYNTLGAENIADATGEAYPQLSAEAIIDANPDVIILADEGLGENADTVSARPGWDTITAVQDGRIYGIDPDIISRPGPRIVDALAPLADSLYAEAAP